MPDTTRFVGREKQLNLFRNGVSNPAGSAYILNLRGPGGIGKTKILEQFVKICTDEKIANTGIIDFYDSDLSSRISSLEIKLTEQLGKQHFKEYWRLREDYDLNPTLGKALKLKVQFISELKQWSQSTLGQRSVLIFDTFEKVKDNLVGERLIKDWLPVLQSSLVVISGRQSEGEIRFPSEIAHLVIDNLVDRFEPIEAESYLKQRKVWSLIVENGMVDKCFAVTNLRPLRLALSADWLIENAAGDVTPKTLFNRETDNFERELVVGLINVINKPENEIIPYMAHIPRPFDRELLQFLNLPTLNDKSIDVVLSNLSNLSFVKHIRDAQGNDFYWFQDELRELFHKYVFEAYPANWNPIRQHASEIMLQFIDNKIAYLENAHNDRRVQLNIARKLYHEIYLEPQAGYKQYRTLFSKAWRNNQIGYAASLIEAAKLAASFLTKDNNDSIQLDEARLLREIGNYPQALRIITKLVDIYKEDKKSLRLIYSRRASILERMGELRESLEQYRVALALIQELNLNETLASELLNIGQIYRAIGDIDQAVEYIQKGYDAAQQFNSTDWDLQVRLSYELGYSLAQKNEFEAGIHYCNEAIEMCEEFQLPANFMARAKMHRGVIYHYQNKFEQSQTDLDSAIALYGVDNPHGQSKVYYHKGIANFARYRDTQDKVFLQVAEDTLDLSIKLSREIGDLEQLPNTLDQISNVYWVQGRYKEARQTVEEAHRLGVATHDIPTSVNSLVGMAEFDYDEGKYDNLWNYAHTLKEKYEDKGYKHPLYYGRMRRILGSVALKQHDLKQSIEYYGAGLYLIAQQGGYGWRFLESELANLTDTIESLPNQESLELCNGLKDYWLAIESNVEQRLLVNWINPVVNRLKRKLYQSTVSN